MGAFTKLIDVILFLFFVLMAVSPPLIDGQMFLPLSLFPNFLIDLKQWYIREFGDYLLLEKPNFFVGLVWLELLFQWPLILISLYALLASKPWFNTTCLICGASFFSTTVPILSELVWSGKASDKLLMMYFPFLGFGALAMFRGLMPNSRKTGVSVAGKRAALGRKKRV